MIRKLFTLCNNKYLNYTCLFFIITSVLIFLYSCKVETFAQFAEVSVSLILIQFLSFFIGSFFGFLFGFPNHSNSSIHDKYQRNTSLKEITSWLTKIIVGVTLIELRNILDKLNYIINSFSYSLTADYSLYPIITSIIGIYFVLGFVVFFILSVTTIFGELVANDRNIESIISSWEMDPTELGIHNVLNLDISDLDYKLKNKVLSYVSKNGVEGFDSNLTKRLAKFLLSINEYSYAVEAYELAYSKNKNDKYSLLNACYIRSKFLKEFDNSNDKLKEMIQKYPDFAPIYYNLACNYNREYKELGNMNNHSEYLSSLYAKVEKYLKLAFEKDKGLYSEALKDKELSGIDIDTIFKDSKKKKEENDVE